MCIMNANCASEPVWILAFSGHRPGKGPGRTEEELKNCGVHIQRFMELFQSRAQKRGGHIEVLSSVASGADTEACQAALRLGIPLHVILPMPEESFFQDFGGEDDPSWMQTKAIIDDAKDGINGGTFRVSAGESARPACYHAMNRVMLEASDGLIAVFNGEQSDAIGGTAEVVKEASRLGLPIAIINPADNADPQLDSSWNAWPK